MRPSDRLNASRERVLALVESHGARHVRVFGSAAELGAKVDLCTEPELHPLLRDRILAEARTL